MGSFAERLQKINKEQRRFALRNLPTHLAKSNQQERLQQLLTTFDFLQTKVAQFGPQPLIEDYSPVNDKDFKQIQSSLRLSAHLLAEDTTQLAGQLLGRLLSISTSPIKTLLKQTHPPLSLAQCLFVRINQYL